MTWWSTCRATCRRWTPISSRRWWRRWPNRAPISPPWPRPSTMRPTRPIPRWSRRWWPGMPMRGWAGRCISPARTAPTGEGTLYHHVGLYAYRREALESFVALPPSPLEEREKLEQLRALEAGMSICGGACGRSAAVCRYSRRSGKSPQDAVVSKAIAKCQTHRLSGRAGRLCQSGGARGGAACRRPFPSPPSKTPSRRRSAGDTDLVIIPVENSLIGRIADIHHLLAGFGPAYRGRTFPAHPPSAAGPEGRDPGRHQKRLQPGAGAGPVPHDSARAQAGGAQLVRHGGFGQACRRTGRQKRRGHRFQPGGGILRPEDPEGRCRRRASQRHALSGHVAPERARAQHAARW